jgi:hypothetical protein
MWLIASNTLPFVLYLQMIVTNLETSVV